MPYVGKKKFSYGKAGRKKAMQYAKKTCKTLKKRRVEQLNGYFGYNSI